MTYLRIFFCHPKLIFTCLILFFCQMGNSHSFGQTYTLPVPLTLYLYGAAAAVATSFLIFAYFLRDDHTTTIPAKPASKIDIPVNASLHKTLRLTKLWLKIFSVLMLLLCIASGFLGNRNPYGNFNMAFFWVIFILAYAYSCALFGNSFLWLNPWRTIANGLGRIYPRYRLGLTTYPVKLSYWPAVLLYMGFIWIELFGTTTPRSLSEYLLAYTALTLFFCGFFGIESWCRYGEFFNVFFSLLSKMRITSLASNKQSQELTICFHSPVAKLNHSQPKELSLLVFILCMLASTAFDGLHETQLWIRSFWVELNPYLQPYVGKNPFVAYPKLRTFYLVYQSAWLLILPVLYFLVYFSFIWLCKRIAKSNLSTRELSLHFAYSLLPIVLAYHLSHYYPLLQTQGIKIISLASDPFGMGANIFGTANWFRAPIIPNVETIWHSQLALIVGGHIMSIYIAHLQALSLFGSRRQALLSQLPMLVLMVAFTVLGLWILSLPMGTSN
jgi:hypothetical protein